MVSGVCLQKTDFNYVSESNDVISSEQQHKLDDPKDEVSMWCQLFSYKGSYLDFYTYYHLACVLAIFGITLYRHSLSKSSCIWQSFIPLTYRLDAWICYSSFISGCFIQLSFSSKFSFNYLLRENILRFLAMDQLAESFSLSWKKNHALFPLAPSHFCERNLTNHINCYGNTHLSSHIFSTYFCFLGRFFSGGSYI